MEKTPKEIQRDLLDDIANLCNASRESWIMGNIEHSSSRLREMILKARTLLFEMRGHT